MERNNRLMAKPTDSSSSTMATNVSILLIANIPDTGKHPMGTNYISRRVEGSRKYVYWTLVQPACRGVRRCVARTGGYVFSVEPISVARHTAGRRPTKLC